MRRREVIRLRMRRGGKEGEKEREMKERRIKKDNINKKRDKSWRGRKRGKKGERREEKGGRREEKGIIETRRERGEEKEKKKQRETCSLVSLALLTGTHHERHEGWARDLREK